jgi:hypothetical protein
MPREIVEPQTKDDGDETHPAFGIAHVGRITATPGQVLFDSDLRHHEYIELTVSTATRTRNLKRDWIHARHAVVKIAMSLAQWASLVASAGTEGVPVTIDYLEGEHTPGLPYQPRLAVSRQETIDAAERAFGEIKGALARYETALAEHAPAAARKSALATLRASVNNAIPNVDYAGQQFAAFAENVVEKSRADVESMVAQATAAEGRLLDVWPPIIPELEAHLD